MSGQSPICRDRLTATPSGCAQKGWPIFREPGRSVSPAGRGGKTAPDNLAAPTPRSPAWRRSTGAAAGAAWPTRTSVLHVLELLLLFVGEDLAELAIDVLLQVLQLL